MRKCFLHVGLHKTGTTSIQQMLGSANDALQAKGFYYPKSGLIEGLPGHHNLAWEMSNDPRFRRERGGIAELIAEIKGRRETVIMSSEDFSIALFQPAFREFHAALRSAGLDLTLVLYFRNQLEWMPRVYFTLIQAGWMAAWENTPSIWIDYGEILKRALGNGEVIVRSHLGTVCVDFLSVLGLTLADLNLGPVRVNKSRPLREYLLLFAQNRLRRELFEEERDAIEALVPATEMRIQLSAVESAKVMERFKVTNRILLDDYGIPEPTLATQEGPCVDLLFSESVMSQISRREDRSRIRQLFLQA